MVSEYSAPDRILFDESHGTLHVAKYNGSDALKIISVYSIQSVVAMVPFPLSVHEAEDVGFQNRFSQCFFVAEKPFLDFVGSTGNLQTGTNDVQETEFNSPIGDGKEDDEEQNDEEEDGIEGYRGDLESDEDE